MPLPLPDEVWEAVADFLQSNLLSLVSRQLWRLLQRRYLNVRWQNDPGTLASRLCYLDAPETPTHVLAVKLYSRFSDTPTCGVPALAWMPRLSGLQLLQRLTLSLAMCYIDENGVRALTTLAGLQALHTLLLNLSYNVIGTAGVRALLALRDAPALTSLQLFLACNEGGG
eukprot:EG_transcript_34807